MNTRAVNVPDWVWWLTLAGAAAIITLTGLGIFLLALGAADPPTAGRVRWSDPDLLWANGPVITLDAGESRWFAAPDAAALPPERFTLDVSARITPASEPGTAWGVWLETTSGGRAIYAISGDGYTTTRLCGADSLAIVPLEVCPALRPEWRWFPYPRIYPPGSTNTITLHVETNTGDIRLRLNREIMGAAAIHWSGRWGVWLRGGRIAGINGVAGTVEWDSANIYAP